MSPPQNEEWHVICSSGRDFNFQPKQKQVITNHILHEYHYVLNSSDNYRESSTECFVICFCLYIAITFHNNLTDAKIANELTMSIQSLNILHLNYSTKSCLISWPARLVIPWMLQNFHVLGFRFWPITRSEILLSSIYVGSQEQLILTDIVHCCSGVTYPYLMKQDFFSLIILHENSLQLPFYI